MFSRRLTTRVELFEQLLLLIENLKTNIRYSGDSLEHIISKEYYSVLTPLLSTCTDTLKNGSSFYESWNLGTNTLAKNINLTEQEKNSLLEFGKGLGSSDVDGQCSHCKLYENVFKEYLKLCKDDKKNKVKLYRSLGIFSGLALAIFII